MVLYNNTMMKNIKQTDYAYIAGYIDGDGCFYIAKFRAKNRISIKFPMGIIISSTNEKIITWFKNLFGGSQRSVKKNDGHRKNMHYFILRKIAGVELTTNIFPYLVEKKEEAKVFVNFAHSNNANHKIKLISKMKILKDVTNLVSKYHIEEFEEFKNTIAPTELDFAYLAGFIDAECSLNIQKYLPKDRPNHVYKIILQCNNTKAPVFKWLLQRFGGQIHFIDRRNHGKARRNQITWRLSGNALSKILDKIYPFLKYKQPVCEQLMKFYQTTLPNGGARHTETFRTQYSEVIKIREEIVINVHKLNLKGISSY
jgi:hypothetical protein